MPIRIPHRPYGGRTKPEDVATPDLAEEPLRHRRYFYRLRGDCTPLLRKNDCKQHLYSFFLPAKVLERYVDYCDNTRVRALWREIFPEGGRNG